MSMLPSCCVLLYAQLQLALVMLFVRTPPEYEVVSLELLLVDQACQIGLAGRDVDGPDAVRQVEVHGQPGQRQVKDLTHPQVGNLWT